MPGLIPQRFIDDLLSRVDILDVVDPRVKLKKTGKNYAGLCPFHQEKSPSFTVQPDKQFYYCFGCGAGGNAIGFVMNFDNLDFPEAVEALAKDAGLEVPREESGQARQVSGQHDALLKLLQEVNEFYQLQLRQHPQKDRAVAYLKGRGLSGAIARDFCLGYAPPGWSNLLQTFGTTPEKQKLLFEAGMLVEGSDTSKGDYYDRFRDRVMYPIRDSRGRVIGFGGRVLGDDKPKYLNSPETPVFHKSEELYGLYEARHHKKNPERFVIVEGYMDVIALAQNGIHYSVATLGTATSGVHLRTLFKHVSEVVFCFDGDNAGREAAWRALQQALPLLEDGRSARFLFLPEGQDPDTHIRRVGAVAFEAALASATRLPDFFFATVGAKLDRNSMEGKAQLGRQALPLIDKLPKGIFRQLMLDELAKQTGVAVSTLVPQFAAPSPPVEQRGPDGPPPAPPSTYAPRVKPAPARIRMELSPCLKAVKMLIRMPSIINSVTISDALGEVRTSDLDLLMKVVEVARAWPDSSPPELLSRIYATAYGAQMTELLSREQITPETGVEDEFREIIGGLLGQHQKAQQKKALIDQARQRLNARRPVQAVE